MLFGKTEFTVHNRDWLDMALDPGTSKGVWKQLSIQADWTELDLTLFFHKIQDFYNHWVIAVTAYLTAEVYQQYYTQFFIVV